METSYSWKQPKLANSSESSICILGGNVSTSQKINLFIYISILFPDFKKKKLEFFF